MNEENIRFVLPLSFSTKIASQLISQNLKALQSPLSGLYYKGRPMFHVKEDITIDGVSLRAHLFHDEKRKANEIEHLMRRIVEIEDRVITKEFGSKKSVQEYMRKTFKGSHRIFNIIGQPPSFRLQRRPKAISRLMNRMGKTILLTNDPKLDQQHLLNLYRRKDVLEKMFDVIKNELNSGRLRVSSIEAMEGRLFLMFLSLIVYSSLSQIMKEKNLYKTYTLSEVFYELKKLRAVTLNTRKTYLTEVTKKQRYLYEKFDLPIPVQPSY